jgi:hypothetical protein
VRNLRRRDGGAVPASEAGAEELEQFGAQALIGGHEHALHQSDGGFMRVAVGDQDASGLAVGIGIQRIQRGCGVECLGQVREAPVDGGDQMFEIGVLGFSTAEAAIPRERWRSTSWSRWSLTIAAQRWRRCRARW